LKNRHVCPEAEIGSVSVLSLSASLVTVMVQFVLPYFSAQGVPVNAQHLRRAALIPIRSIQSAPDQPLFKFPHGFIEQDSLVHHLRHKSFQLIFHNGTLRPSPF
jgi:hypothetical protein